MSPSERDVGPSDAERQLVDRARDGDREAFRTLVEEHQHKVYGLVRRVLRCDREQAADLAQEVFLRVFRGLPRFDGSARFMTWVHKIAMNVCISEYRKERALKRDRWTFSLDAPVRGTDDLFLEPQARNPGPAARAEHREIARAVRVAVDELPEDFRMAVVLRDLQGLAYEEIAEILGVPVGTVRSRIHRGRLLLQARLAEYRP